MSKMTTGERVATMLLGAGAVFLRPEKPFVWASGIKSPIYCDNRLTLSDVAARSAVEIGFGELIQKKYPEVDILMGTSTAGIPHAAITADLLNLPMGYVRSGNKDHGRQNRIEGGLVKGEKVVVIEDLISTGGSVIEVVNTLRDAGAEVLGVICIFTYNMEIARENLAAANVQWDSLTDFDTVVRIAVKKGYISKDDVPRLMKFRDDPSDESWIGGNV